MSVIKTTQLKLVEAIGWEFSANVLGVYKDTIKLCVNDSEYSLKTPKDFKINNLKCGDVIDVTYEINGERVNLLVAAVYEDGKKLKVRDRQIDEKDKQ